MTQSEQKNLINIALEAREAAYIPYSGWGVGAALLTKGGKIYKGCNIENAAFGPTNCAERTAFFTAVCAGERDFEAIAVVGAKAGTKPEELCYPCGVCRQVMVEFCPSDFTVIVAADEDNYKVYKLKEILPFSFGDEMKGNPSQENLV